MIFLVDCNNFFVSCERARSPHLVGKPVVVVSSVGGIVLARSEEAKRLQIPMGAPTFKCEDIFKKYNVFVLSCDFSLYSALSHQVMEVLKEFSPDVEVASIDEAYLLMLQESEETAFAIKERVYEKTKIPVSIGIAKTRTLCKAAVFFAKKGSGVCVIEQDAQDEFLQKLPIEEVWGIGKKLAERLRKMSIHTAFDFIQLPDALLKKELSVGGLRIAFELRGVPSFTLFEGRDGKKSISTARSFKKPLMTFDEIALVLKRYTTEVALELRQEKKLASVITVSLSTSSFGEKEKYEGSNHYVFHEPTSYTPALVREALLLLKSIYKQGFIYKKVGVTLSEFVSEEDVQLDLFERAASSKKSEKHAKIMEVVDEINSKFGKKKLGYASSSDVSSK